MNLRQTLAVAVATATTVSALADVKINENLSVNGYIVGAATTTEIDGGGEIDTYFESKGSPAIVNADAAKMGLLGTVGQISAYGSILYLPGAANEAGLLDAYVTYDTGVGLKITGGKFLSYLGYEAFDPINMAQLTYGSTIYAIPGYHSGAKLDYATKTFSIGLAVVDSVFHGPNGFFEGDREFDDDIGAELVFTYTGIDKLTVFAGIATEDTDFPPGTSGSDVFVFDLWASYALTDRVTIAGEYDQMDDTGDGFLGFVSYKFNDKFSTVFRASTWKWDDAAGGGREKKYTIAPTLTLTPNISFRAEYSKGDTPAGDYDFIGIQGVLKF